MPQHAVREVARAAVRVDQLVRERVVVDRVDGEVASARRLGDRQGRVGRDVEALVPETAFRLAAREGDVDVEVLDLEDAEGDSHKVERVRRAEDALEVVRRDAEHLDVHVLHALPAQEVAHGSAHHQRAAARGAHALRHVHRRRAQVVRQVRQVNFHRIHHTVSPRSTSHPATPKMCENSTAPAQAS